MTKSKFFNSILFWSEFSVNSLMQYRAVEIEHHSRAWIPASIKTISLFETALDRHAERHCDCDEVEFRCPFDDSMPADFKVFSDFEFVWQKSFEMRIDLMGRFSYEYPIVVTVIDFEYFNCNDSRYWFISQWRKYFLRKSIQTEKSIFNIFFSAVWRSIQDNFHNGNLDWGNQATIEWTFAKGWCTQPWRIIIMQTRWITFEFRIALRSYFFQCVQLCQQKLNENCVSVNDKFVDCENWSSGVLRVMPHMRKKMNSLKWIMKIESHSLTEIAILMSGKLFIKTESLTIKLHEVSQAMVILLVINTYFYLLSRIQRQNMIWFGAWHLVNISECKKFFFSNFVVIADISASIVIPANQCHHKLTNYFIHFLNII